MTAPSEVTDTRIKVPDFDYAPMWLIPYVPAREPNENRTRRLAGQILDAINEIVLSHNKLNPNRVHIEGFSQGAYMAFQSTALFFSEHPHKYSFSLVSTVNTAHPATGYLSAMRGMWVADAVIYRSIVDQGEEQSPRPSTSTSTRSRGHEDVQNSSTSWPIPVLLAYNSGDRFAMGMDQTERTLEDAPSSGSCCGSFFGRLCHRRRKKQRLIRKSHQWDRMLAKLLGVSADGEECSPPRPVENSDLGTPVDLEQDPKILQLSTQDYFAGPGDRLQLRLVQHDGRNQFVSSWQNNWHGHCIPAKTPRKSETMQCQQALRLKGNDEWGKVLLDFFQKTWEQQEARKKIL